MSSFMLDSVAMALVFHASRSRSMSITLIEKKSEFSFLCQLAVLFITLSDLAEQKIFTKGFTLFDKIFYYIFISHKGRISS